MTLLLWFCGLAMTGILLAAWREGRDAAPDRWWAYPVQPVVAEAVVEPVAPVRASRPALQTGVAILAVALALDVSSAPLAWFAPIEPEAAPSVAASGLLDFTDGTHAGFSADAPAIWSLSATSTDGWFV